MLDKKTPRMVKYNEGDTLSITIKPDDKLQGDFNKTGGIERLLDFYNYYNTKLNRLMNPKHYTFWFRVELSEPIGEDVHNQPRFHLHGYIKLKTKHAVFIWLTEVMPDLLIHARLQINHLIDDENNSWIEYCKKQHLYIPRNQSTISNEVDIS